jgi:hypothetical protein
MITFETRFDEENQIDPWGNQLAKDLNALLEHADLCFEELAQATLRVVQHVAEFEQIEER